MSLIGAVAQQGNRVAAYKAINCYYSNSEIKWVNENIVAVTVYVSNAALTTINGAYSTSAIIYSDSLGTTVAASGWYGDTAGGGGSTASVWDNGTSAWITQTVYYYPLSGFYAVDGGNYCATGAAAVTVYTENASYANIEAVFNAEPIYSSFKTRTDATTGNYGDTAGGGGSGKNYMWDHGWGGQTDCT
jgi:hypothetical protein